MLSIELPEEVNNRLELLSLSTGRTMQYYIHEAILEYLDNIEDRYQEIDYSSNNYLSFEGVDDAYGMENNL